MKKPSVIIYKTGTSAENKTGGWRSEKPVVSKELCIKCGICSDLCPEGCIEIKDDGAEIDYDYCKGCGICAEECPKNAIKMVKEVK